MTQYLLKKVPDSRYYDLMENLKNFVESSQADYVVVEKQH